MSKEFRTKKNILIVSLFGEIDQYAAAELKSKIDLEIQACTKKNVIIDLGNVTMMDSSGIGLIVGRYKTATSLQKNFALCSADKTIERIIALSGIGKVIKSFENLERAEEYLEKLCTRERKE